RGRTRPQLAWFLLTRGLWLVFLELTLVHFGWTFHFDYSRFLGPGVIWAIGWSMVILAGLVFLPTSAVVVVGVVLVGYHNLLDPPLKPEEVGLPQWLWVVLLRPGGFEVVDGVNFGTGYCVLPWLGVMAAGYGLGALYLLDRGERRRQLL